MLADTESQFGDDADDAASVAGSLRRSSRIAGRQSAALRQAELIAYARGGRQARGASGADACETASQIGLNDRDDLVSEFGAQSLRRSQRIAHRRGTSVNPMTPTLHPPDGKSAACSPSQQISSYEEWPSAWFEEQRKRLESIFRRPALAICECALRHTFKRRCREAFCRQTEGLLRAATEREAALLKNWRAEVEQLQADLNAEREARLQDAKEMREARQQEIREARLQEAKEIREARLQEAKAHTKPLPPRAKVKATAQGAKVQGKPRVTSLRRFTAMGARRASQSNSHELSRKLTQAARAKPRSKKREAAETRDAKRTNEHAVAHATVDAMPPPSRRSGSANSALPEGLRSPSPLLKPGPASPLLPPDLTSSFSMPPALQSASPVSPPMEFVGRPVGKGAKVASGFLPWPSEITLTRSRARL